MPTCPNCSYKLVLLSHRSKYKCSLCSRLYPQKLIENKAFKEWNKLQKLQDITNLDIKRKQELKQIREIKKSLRYLFKGLPNSLSKEYNGQKCREWRLKNRQYDLKRKQKYHQRNKEIVNLRTRIRNYRIRQKQLALRFLEENENNILRSKYMDTTCTSLLWKK